LTLHGLKSDETAARILWSAVLAFAGLLDILATVLPSIWDGGSCTAKPSNTCSPNSISKQPDFVNWLERHHIAISFFSSTLWFIDAFRKTHVAKQLVKSDLEHEILVRGTANKSTKWNSNAAYYKAILWQLLLLPVGFYIALYLLIQRFGAGQYNIPDLDQVDEKVVVKEASMGGYDEQHYEVFSVGSKRAFLFVIAHFIVGETGEAAVSMARLKWTETLRRIVRKLFGWISSRQ
jgi:hypothetical protein